MTLVSRAVTRAVTRLLPIGALVAAAVTGSCTDINAAADHVASLEFDTLPFPAVVAGDSLRDSLGHVRPLRAVAFNSAGDVVPDAAIQYIALDSGVAIDGNDILVAQRKTGTVRLIASTDKIQSGFKLLTVARPPAIVIVPGKLVDTVNTSLLNPAANVSGGLGVKVITADTADGIGVTQGWLVSYQAFFHNVAIAPGDTSVAFLVDGTRRTSLDTTSTDGTASRSVQVKPIGITSQLDSVIVMATVRYKGAQVQGSPVRFVILVRSN